MQRKSLHGNVCLRVKVSAKGKATNCLTQHEEDRRLKPVCSGAGGGESSGTRFWPKQNCPGAAPGRPAEFPGLPRLAWTGPFLLPAAAAALTLAEAGLQGHGGLRLVILPAGFFRGGWVLHEPPCAPRTSCGLLWWLQWAGGHSRPPALGGPLRSLCQGGGCSGVAGAPGLHHQHNGCHGTPASPS